MLRRQLGFARHGRLVSGQRARRLPEGLTRRAVAAAWGAPVLPVLGVATGQLYELGLETENVLLEREVVGVVAEGLLDLEGHLLDIEEEEGDHRHRRRRDPAVLADERERQRHEPKHEE